MKSVPTLSELIEQYLNGQLSAADKQAFETRLELEPGLKAETANYEILLKGVKRNAMKFFIRKQFRSFQLTKLLIKTTLIILSAAAIGTTAYLGAKALHHKAQSGLNQLPDTNEDGEALWADADRNLPACFIYINNTKDTVIQSKNGVLYAIPANTFVNEKNEISGGQVKIDLKEALDPVSIIQAGLSTRSGDKLLETGGMFYINAYDGDKQLKIASGKSITVQVPTAKINPRMQLFDGKRKADGAIDWVKPRPLEHFLIPVNILKLNFYPPAYLDTLAAMGYDRRNKKFSDSLYYSFAWEVKPAAMAQSPEEIERIARSFALLQHPYDGETGYILDKNNTERYDSPEKRLADSLRKKSDSTDTTEIIYDYLYGVNPAKIKAIWNQTFANTLLATKEFEERMPYIHRSCQSEMLDLYVNNLDKNMYQIDSMAVILAGERVDLAEAFKVFQERHDGKVRRGNRNLELLQRYYEQKSTLFAQAVAKTNQDFWTRQEELDKKSEVLHAKEEATKLEEAQQETLRVQENFAKEVKINLKEAYRQLGKYIDTTTRPQTVYTATVTTLGWKNIDAYVLESTASRATLDYTDPVSGKKAVIRYLPLEVSVKGAESYDRLDVYLLPDKLNSYMRMPLVDGAYKESLNELMTYKLIALGHKNGKIFYQSLQSAQAGKEVIELQAGTDKELARLLHKEPGFEEKVAALRAEIEFHQYAVIDKKRKAKLASLRELSTRISPVVIPCAAYLMEGVSEKHSVYMK